MAAGAYAWPRFGAGADPEAAAARTREEAAAQGYAEGLARAEAERKNQREALASALAELPHQLERLGDEQVRAVAELAFAVARKLLRAELRTNPAVLEALVHEALTALEAGIEDARVLVCPDDHQPLVEALARLGDEAPSVSPKPDPSVPPGGVSVSLGVRSVEFDPLGRLESFAEQETSDGTGDRAPIGAEPAV